MLQDGLVGRDEHGPLGGHELGDARSFPSGRI
jgi:hypothetical protein